jgi:hypothetical protein
MTAPRDASAARGKAEALIDRARRISTAVESFHLAADQIEEAQRVIAQASAGRIAALREMRDAGLSIGEMVELTALSASRIQALLHVELQSMNGKVAAAEEPA